MDPITVCHLIGRGLIIANTNGGNSDFRYKDLWGNYRDLRDGKPAISPVPGFMIDGRLNYTDAVKNDSPIKFRTMFAALPCVNGGYIDKNSFAMFRYFGTKYSNVRSHCKKDSEVEGMLKTTMDFTEKFCSKCHLSGEESRSAVMLGMCSAFRTYGHDIDDILSDLMRCAKMKNGESDRALIKEAETRYYGMVRCVIRGWIIMARENGIKCFIGGPVGCGVFGNDVNMIAKIFAQEFVQHSGGMTFVCAVPDKGIADVFERAFKWAFDRRDAPEVDDTNSDYTTLF